MSSESKGDGSEVTVMESGHVSGLVRQFDEIVDGPAQPPSPPRDAPRKRKKLVGREFDMFEKSGMVMGMVRMTLHIFF